MERCLIGWSLMRPAYTSCTSCTSCKESWMQTRQGRARQGRRGCRRHPPPLLPLLHPLPPPWPLTGVRVVHPHDGGGVLGAGAGGLLHLPGVGVDGAGLHHVVLGVLACNQRGYMDGR